ncbi:hypothetical protein ACRAWB_18240 [Leifsonia poae]|uniref:hypothetical protein n=1 Tax=Leifsonia poae TaxID=110933 RepID=UPI003D687754
MQTIPQSGTLEQEHDADQEPNELHYILRSRIDQARLQRTSARALCGEVLDDVDPRSQGGGDGVKRSLCISCEWIYDHLPEG